MEVLRITLKQSSANYKKEETIINKTTYPLPPFSTVIGAVHCACGYERYHPMDISIQGRYESMHKEPYTDYCFFNSIQDDRGILVKMKNGNLLSTAFDIVAKAKKPQGNSFRKGISIDVINNDLLEEYIRLKDLSEEIDEFQKGRISRTEALIKKRTKTLKEKKRDAEPNSSALELIVKREKEIKELGKLIKKRFEEYKNLEYKTPYSQFASLVTSLKYYEVLNNIILVIHIKADRETLADIEKNIYNLKSIGRSEDFVDIEEVCFVNLSDSTNKEITNEYSSYIDYNLIKDGYVFPRSKHSGGADGTKYYINKDYEIVDDKRVFHKIKVVYVSYYSAKESCDKMLFDLSGGKPYIINFN